MLPMNLYRMPGGDAARVDRVTSWISRRSPHAIVPDGSSAVPLHGGEGYLDLGDDFGALPVDAAKILFLSFAPRNTAMGALLGALFGAVAGKGGRFKGAAVGALLGGLTGVAATIYAAQNTIATANAAAAAGTIATIRTP